MVMTAPLDSYPQPVMPVLTRREHHVEVPDVEAALAKADNLGGKRQRSPGRTSAAVRSLSRVGQSQLQQGPELGEFSHSEAAERPGFFN